MSFAAKEKKAVESKTNKHLSPPYKNYLDKVQFFKNHHYFMNRVDLPLYLQRNHLQEANRHQSDHGVSWRSEAYFNHENYNNKKEQ